MQIDRNGLEVLTHVECLQLLGHAVVGRVVVTDRALPAAFPVNFAVLDEDVVFLTSPGSNLEAAAVETVVAFQVDDIDPVERGGWSVLIQGPAALIVEPEELARARTLSLEPWAPVEQPHFVRVRSEIVSGRRIVARAGDPCAGPAAARVALPRSEHTSRP